MKLSKRDESTSNYSTQGTTYKKAAPVDWKLFAINYSAVIPHGKYKGKTVSDIEKDDYYWSWMYDNNIFAEWELVKERKHVKSKNKHYNPLVCHNGEVWLCIYEVPVSI